MFKASVWGRWPDIAGRTQLFNVAQTLELFSAESFLAPERPQDHGHTYQWTGKGLETMELRQDLEWEKNVIQVFGVVLVSCIRSFTDRAPTTSPLLLMTPCTLISCSIIVEDILRRTLGLLQHGNNVYNESLISWPWGQNGNFRKLHCCEERTSRIARIPSPIWPCQVFTSPRDVSFHDTVDHSEVGLYKWQLLWKKKENRTIYVQWWCIGTSWTVVESHYLANLGSSLYYLYI